MTRSVVMTQGPLIQPVPETDLALVLRKSEVSNVKLEYLVAPVVSGPITLGASLGQVIENRYMMSLPNIGRNPLSLLNLTPGVTGAGGALNPTNTNFVANGTRNSTSDVLVDGRWVVRDLDSLNGTYVDDERLTAPTPLNDGARLRIGDVVFRANRAGAEAGPEGARQYADERVGPAKGPGDNGNNANAAEPGDPGSAPQSARQYFLEL